MAIGILISLLTGCAFGLAPALRLSRLSVIDAMKPAIGAASRGRARFRSALVVTQVAAAVTLLAVGGLVVRTFLTLLPSSPGFATESRAAFAWTLRENQFPDAADRRRRINLLVQRLEAVPEVNSVAVASGMPFDDVCDRAAAGADLRRRGDPDDPDSRRRGLSSRPPRRTRGSDDLAPRRVTLMLRPFRIDPGGALRTFGVREGRSPGG